MQLPRGLIFLVSASVVLTLAGCSSVGYYWQAVHGHFAIVDREQPIDKVLAQKQLDPDLRHKLKLIQQARDFARKQLDLPVDDNYTTYADLKRPFVTWNVVATPPLSVTPKRWCYLFAGCFNYRGYFHEQAAKAFARQLKRQGKDVAIAGAWAYSTLGWFDDPVLNTMLAHDEADVVGTLFHELGHQTVYVKNDSSFNESFANTVEQEGLRRWYLSIDKPVQYREYLQRQHEHNMVIAMLEQTRAELRRLYAEPISDADKQRQKQAAFAALKRRYQTWRRRHAYDTFDKWMKQHLNNAHLALIATYSDKVPAFRAMLAAVDNKLPAFYALAKKVGAMPPEQRNATLAAYLNKAQH